MTPHYRELFNALLPELALVLGALLVLSVDLIAGRGRAAAARLRVSVSIGLLALAAAGYGAHLAGKGGPAFDGVFALDALGFAVRLGVIALGVLTLGLLPGVSRLRHPAEYVAVMLLATCGFTLMAVAQQLLVAFLALELASLSLYVLTGFDKSRPESAEAALKYFLVGGMSAAFLLFGFSLIYGLTGSIELPAIAFQLRGLPVTTLLIVALVMVLTAFGFKAAAAPFHLWAPDVYQGAPASSAALVASASKLAGFALFVRLLWSGLAPVAGDLTGTGTSPGWVTIVVIISAVSLVLGNIAALAQTNVRRLLAYSAIAHAGALLLGVIAAGKSGPAPLFYYALTYGFATVGAFGVIAVVERAGRCQSLSDLAGLYRRSPLLAGCLFIFILSLAGIPPLAGFFGKFTVFAGALKLNGLSSPAGWLALLAIGMSAVGLYYYLLILKQAVVAAPVAGAETKIPVPAMAAASLVIAAALLVVVGIFPSVVLQMLP
ncbi:NADH-quinone oxidoreductase subunit N [Horticoccus sp. 23ND18S-11]|uniref:NADH-quinone oxidoreductase subunit N n=1 Tax=Horticoccus sp. 23ND18S-11 TaxID=3391832 RepID=UPI0039C9D9A7